MSGSPVLERYQASLSGLARRNRLRGLSDRQGIDFASNDYLGLARSKRMADAVALALAAGTPVGATGSRLLRGNTPEHEALEAKAAHFFG
ncbi:8-amino-7-oxononanoate synthase, partial [Mesorhizobium sp. M1A.F.Ca.IN.020.06.1.1]